MSNSPTLPLSRQHTIDYLSESLFDVLIVGGGIHGAAIASQAAMSGLKVALLEKGDYASATSSRSSKMAHGGLRYLEMGDFQQVFEGIKARERLFEEYPHLVKPHRFLIPVDTKAHLFKNKLKMGLILYDLMVRKKERRHGWVAGSDLKEAGYRGDESGLAGCFYYTDGILSDCRLVFEKIHNARTLGASCLNYAPVEQIGNLEGRDVSTLWRDSLTGARHLVRSRIVVNCAGPWAPFLNHSSLKSEGVKARYSQGTHLLFDQPWDGPALFLPLASKARYYFVWPHFAGTMVGTTEREVDRLEGDPQPDASEIKEILTRLKEDLPDAGLDIDSLHYAFAGVRTLPVRKGAAETGRLSRRHIWSYENGLLTLLGGKLTTADMTAREGMKRIAMALGINVPLNQQQKPRQLDRLRFDKYAAEAGLSEAQRERLWSRYGPRAFNCLQSSADAAPLGRFAIAGELRYAIEVEQAETLEDILRRRLELEYMPGCGVEALGDILSAFSIHKDAERMRREFVQYYSRIERLFRSFEKASPLAPLQSVDKHADHQRVAL